MAKDKGTWIKAYRWNWKDHSKQKRHQRLYHNRRSESSRCDCSSHNLKCERQI